jgi:thiamine-phosphate pyrophosphorylase
MTAARPARGEVPRLHVVTDDAVLARPGWIEQALALLGSVTSPIALHVRGPATDGSTLFEITTRLRRARREGSWVIVNDRVDVALAAGADGVHLARRSLPAAEARAILGSEPVLGASLHGSDEVAAARAWGAEFAFVGTIFATPSHAGAAELGEQGLRAAVGRAGGLPLLAIGGVDVARVRGLVRAGAHGVAVVRGVWSRGTPAAAVVEYMDAIEDAHHGGG